MAYKNNSSLLAKFVVITTIMLAVAGQALAGRGIRNEAKNENMKQPEWLNKSDPSFLIPGIGRVMVPPAFRISPHTPHSGHTGAGSGAGAGAGTGSTGSHIPGGDDTFVPNPGFEVPTPGSGGAVPATHP